MKMQKLTVAIIKIEKKINKGPQKVLGVNGSQRTRIIRYVHISTPENVSQPCIHDVQVHRTFCVGIGCETMHIFSTTDGSKDEVSKAIPCYSVHPIWIMSDNSKVHAVCMLWNQEHRGLSPNIKKKK
jgi:hypothetical protein